MRRRRSAGPRDRRELVAIFLGGAIGTMARAEVAVGLGAHPGRWPWATFTVNVAGAFLLGCVATRWPEQTPRCARRRALLGTGLCGGLTTFSTMQVELLGLLDADRVGLAVLYAAASALAGLAAVGLATQLVRRGRVSG